MNYLRKQQLILALAGTLFALAVHFCNYLADPATGIHVTADDASYLRPAENFADHGTWKDNSEGASAYVQRPPLLGLIYLPFYCAFRDYAPLALSGFFFLMHGFALYQLPRIFSRFLTKRMLLFSWLYALLPCFWGFLSYQITEALSPSLVILTIAAILHKGKYSLAALLFLLLCCWMLRPVLILLFPAATYVMIQRRSELLSLQTWWNPLLLLCALSVVFSWEARKAHYMGSWGNMHPIYHASNKSVFRPVHAALTDVFRVWETKPETFHAIVGACWTAPAPGSNDYRSLDFIPSYVRERKVPLTPGNAARPAGGVHQLQQGAARFI